MKQNGKQSETYSVPALKRGLAILKLFSIDRPVITVADISRELQIPRATAFRLVATMTTEGFLQREKDHQGFLLGPQAVNLGFTSLHSQDLLRTARPHLSALRDQLGTSTHLAILDGRFVVYAFRIRSERQTGGWSRTGHRLPAHASACGRALLFDHSAKQLAALLDGVQFELFSDQTPANLDELIERLERERERGFVAYRSAVTPGVAACAAPVRDFSGEIIAAISVADMQTAPSLADLEGAVSRRIISVAQVISKELGYRPL